MRNIKKILLASALPFLLCQSFTAKTNEKETEIIQQEKALINKEAKREKARREPKSLKNSSYSETEHEINYAFSLKGGDDSNTAFADLYDEDETVEYQIKYVKFLDLMFIHSKESNNGEEVENTFYGFAFTNDDGEIDVNYDFDGTSISYSSIIPPLPGGGIGGGIIDPSVTAKTYDLMKIGVEIATIDQAEGIAKEHIKIPDLLSDGPIEYLLYKAKMKMVEDDYDQNAYLTQPSGIINDQNNYSKWYFGLAFDTTNNSFKIEKGTLDKNGCGCIAMYNLLYDSGTKASLAAVIAYTQLCNADLALGAFGVNPLGDDAKEAIKNCLDGFLDEFMVPAMKALASSVSKKIYDEMLSFLPEWLITVLKLTTEQILSATLEMITRALFNAIVDRATTVSFVSSYMNSLSTFTDVIKVFTGDTYTSIPCATYSTFNENLNKYSQSIITYWNNPITKGAHTVYVKRTGIYTAKIYNPASNGTTATFNTKNGDPFYDNDWQFIYAYVWRKN